MEYAVKYKRKMLEYALKKDVESSQKHPTTTNSNGNGSNNENNTYNHTGNKTDLYIIEEDKIPPLVQYIKI